MIIKNHNSSFPVYFLCWQFVCKSGTHLSTNWSFLTCNSCWGENTFIGDVGNRGWKELKSIAFFWTLDFLICINKANQNTFKYPPRKNSTNNQLPYRWILKRKTFLDFALWFIAAFLGFASWGETTLTVKILFPAL